MTDDESEAERFYEITREGAHDGMGKTDETRKTDVEINTHPRSNKHQSEGDQRLGREVLGVRLKVSGVTQSQIRGKACPFSTWMYG